MIPSFDQTKKSLLIKNPTGLILNIFRVMPEEVGKEQRGGGNIIYLIEQIYPNESINIAINTDQPHFYYFVSGAGLLWSNELTYDWTIVDKLDWTAGIDQYQIKLRVLDASSPAPIKVTNVTNMELSIEQLDYSAKFRRVGLLAPGKIY